MGNGNFSGVLSDKQVGCSTNHGDVLFFEIALLAFLSFLGLRVILRGIATRTGLGDLLLLFGRCADHRTRSYHLFSALALSKNTCIYIYNFYCNLQFYRMNFSFLVSLDDMYEVISVSSILKICRRKHLTRGNDPLPHGFGAKFKFSLKKNSWTSV